MSTATTKIRRVESLPSDSGRCRVGSPTDIGVDKRGTSDPPIGDAGRWRARLMRRWTALVEQAPLRGYARGWRTTTPILSGGLPPALTAEGACC
jgi:hypothetical protein